MSSAGDANRREPSSVELEHDWIRFARHLADGLRLRPLIRDSWARSARFGVERSNTPLHRVSEAELERRLEESREVIEIARSHLDWISASLSRRMHVAYLADPDGIVLTSCGTDTDTMHQFGLLPGYDWSERTMGTNGAGTALATGRPVAIVGPEHFSEDYREATCTAAPIRDPDGRIVGAIDVSMAGIEGAPERLSLVSYAAFAVERELAGRRAERQRVEAEIDRERISSVLESITDGFFAVDREWRFRYVNGRAERILRRGRSELMGRSLWQEFPDAVGSVFEREYRRAMRSGATRQFEALYPTLGLWVQVHVYPSEDGLSVYFHDITARKRLEEERRDALDRERQARSEAEAAVALRDDVLAIASHDLQSPLYAIRIHADLLGRADAPEERLRRLDEIRRATDHMERLIHTLLDAARIEAGGMLIEVRTLSVRSLLDDVAGSFRDRLVSAGQTLSLDLKADRRLRVIGDRVRVHQVLSNLVENACKYGGERAQVTVAAEDRGDHVLFSVADTGPGIPPEEVDRVFDRFWQARKSGTLGTGLGLFVSRGIVQAHGGEMWVHSRAGEGTTFYFTLPAPTGGRHRSVPQS